MLRLALIVLGAFLAGPAFSVPIIVDDRAGATGLVWSSPANTVGTSFDQVVAGGWYDAGWRHATSAEICELFAAYADYTLTCPPGGLQDFGDAGAADLVLLNGEEWGLGYPDWGHTYYSYQHCDLFDPDCYEPFTSEVEELDGFFDDGTTGDGLVGRGDVWEFFDQQSFGTRRHQTAFIGSDASASNLVDATMGHWLVCPSGTCQAPAVPEPQLGTLLAGSLALVLAASRGRSRR